MDRMREKISPILTYCRQFMRKFSWNSAVEGERRWISKFVIFKTPYGWIRLWGMIVAFQFSFWFFLGFLFERGLFLLLSLLSFLCFVLVNCLLSRWLFFRPGGICFDLLQPQQTQNIVAVVLNPLSFVSFQ
ncbi:hypothetical protein ACN38_g2432 [Penicillium nordicum]|uniref:Uncharacterized protein n=1 Tax=Penicillium nordicum TaxID=229535 RepID=A0A0M8PA31_9EURO|nr:hypothetical protein ACN38_g2432 [Penicillium nordicum]